MTSTFNLLRAVVIILAKVQGQRSVGTEEWKQTDGHLDGTEVIADCITSLANVVGKHLHNSLTDEAVRENELMYVCMCVCSQMNLNMSSLDVSKADTSAVCHPVALFSVGCVTRSL